MCRPFTIIIFINIRCCRNKIYILENNDGCSTHPHNTYVQILVSNGKSLVITNKNNNQYYIYPLDKTPLVFILDKESIIKKILETEISKVQDKFYMISFEKNNNSINIFFDKNSFNILGWQTEDLYQNLAVTYIFNLQKNKKIDKDKFILPAIN